MHRLTPEIEAQIMTHACADLMHEVGGILIGSHDDAESRATAIIPNVPGQSTRTSVTFTHDVWQNVFEQLDLMEDGSVILGWYHSHPGYGIFLSEDDQFIHRNFFPAPFHVAIVVDPIEGTIGTFAWHEDTITRADASG
jgi:proteasome lid subunit RPN8/RPN11